MNTLLLVEDDKLLRYAMKESLEKEDFIVIEAANGRRSIEIIERHPVDLVLLDLRLPDGSGLDFIPDIRRHTDIPVIIVSGERDKLSKVSGLALGADDYVVKPADIDELVARIRAHLRRFRNEDTNAQRQKSINHTIETKLGNWTFDRVRYDIFDENNQPGGLTIQEFRLLDMLIRHEGEVLKRDDLREALREESYIPMPRAIDVKITRIRKKIGDDAGKQQIIKTVRGAGYMFNHIEG